MKRAVRLILFLTLSIFACRPALKSVFHPTIPIDPSTVGLITGVVRFEGTPPSPTKIPVAGFPDCANPRGEDDDVRIQGGLVENAFVFIRNGLDDYVFPPAEGEVVLDQKGCLYAPRVVGLRVGQTLVVKNGDPTPHNVHALPKFSESFNVAMGGNAADIRKTFDEPEVMVPVRCDIHPWMRAYVGVLRHPVFAVTGPDGAFVLKGIPPGHYTLEAWHERLGTRSLPVTVESGQTVSKMLNF
ncbi:MAG TPA: carboxypeptidase regulatory-like domain-containing protein [bacterium]|nr:carboxypeptidase regulatory-like domain-containing protein [bacterium]